MRNRVLFLALVAGALLFHLGAAQAATLPATTFDFENTATLIVARSEHTATLLPNGYGRIDALPAVDPMSAAQPTQTCPSTITQSSSQAITVGNSLSCNSGAPGYFHHDTSYWRAFNMAAFTGSQQYNVTAVSFAIDTAHSGAGLGQPVTVRLYTNAGGAFPAGTRIQVAATSVTVLDQTQTVFNVPLAATVPAATSELVMEVFTPNGVAAGNSFFIGSNAAAQTGPSYASAADCGNPTPTDTAMLGAPNMHIVFNVNGSCGPMPTPTPAGTPAQAINLSTRMRVQTGDSVGIGGFIITGTAPKRVLLRAIGPSLTQFGVPHALADPVLELHGPGGFVTITNDNWRDDPVQAALIQADGIPPTNDLESAIDATLNPGPYTAIVRGKNNTSGVALVEVYDLNQAVASKLGNISTRAFVSTGNNIVIAGFILGGHSGNDRIIVRGLGPSLTAAGVPNALADPTLELRDTNGTLLIANNDWQDSPAQAAELTAAGLAPGNNLESGIAATLPPGNYTALLAGLKNGTGVGLVEVYDRGGPP